VPSFLRAAKANKAAQTNTTSFNCEATLELSPPYSRNQSLTNKTHRKKGAQEKEKNRKRTKEGARELTCPSPGLDCAVTQQCSKGTIVPADALHLLQPPLHFWRNLTSITCEQHPHKTEKSRSFVHFVLSLVKRQILIHLPGLPHVSTDPSCSNAANASLAL